MPPSATKPPKKTAKASAETHLVFEDRVANEAATQQTRSQVVRDIFGPGANPTKRYLETYEQAAEYSAHIKGLGLKVVFTPGTFDVIHIGHGRYLQKAKELGDILIVGVELDSAIRLRKGPTRPVVPFRERVEMLCHLRHVDMVVPIPDYDSRGLSGMKMIEAIYPNIIVASERSFKEADDTKEWIHRMKPFCEEVQILESQAETSTSSKIRDLIMHVGSLVSEGIQEAEVSMTDTLEQFEETMNRSMTLAVQEAKSSLSDAVKKSFAEVKRRADDAVKKA